jgi:hypothetical protein
MLRLPFVVLLVSGIASAQPKPAPAARVPTRPVPCAKDDLKLFASGLDAVVCWDKGCMKLDMSNSDASWIIKPAATPRWTIPAAEVKDDKACLGTTCKPLGKKLVQAIADTKKDADPANPVTVEATADLKLVVWGGSGNTQAWSLKDDKRLNIAQPAKDRKDPNPRQIVGHTVVGDLIVFNWSACAGPCTEYSIVDSAGRPKGIQGAGGGGVFQLDAKRFVVMSEYAVATVHELGTGKRLSSIDLVSDPGAQDVVRADDETIFVMTGKADGRQVTKVSLPNDKTLKPRIAESMYLPQCHP